MLTSYEGVKRVEFQTASSSADWRMPYKLLVPEINGWDKVKDEVVLGMSPDDITFDDYGVRSRSFPPGSITPFYQASSRSNDGVVNLIDPNLIDVIVPWSTIHSMGPGAVNVGISYRQRDSGSRTTLLIGRLPLVWGVV